MMLHATILAPGLPLPARVGQVDPQPAPRLPHPAAPRVASACCSAPCEWTAGTMGALCSRCGGETEARAAR